MTNNRSNNQHNSDGSECKEDCVGETSLRENVMDQLDEMNEGNPDKIEATGDSFFMDDYLKKIRFQSCRYCLHK